MNMNILDIIDDPCKNLLAEVQNHVRISFELRNDDLREYDYQTIERGEDMLPVVGRIRYYEPIESCKIAHELLHARCGYSLGYDKEIYIMVQNLSTLTARQVLSDMCESILNQTEHYIFFHEYINMGYDSSKFVESISYPETEWRKFVNNYKRTNISVVDVTNLLNTFHHIMLFPIDNRFKAEKQQLKHLERDLFDAFKQFKNSLPDMSKLSSDQIYPIAPQYKKLLEGIDTWCKMKRLW